MKENSLSWKILLKIPETTENLFKLSYLILVEPQKFTKWSPVYLGPSNISKAISNLKRTGYLKEKKIENKKKLYLAPKGRAEIIKYILKNKLLKKIKWDGEWRAIIFDIPELSRRDRDFLRRELRWAGFKELQKSVWVFPYEFEKELSALLKLWKIEFRGDIRFLTIKKIENDDDLREYFGLK